MKHYTKIYLDFAKLDPHEIRCEVCKKQAVDVHHIKARGMGGSYFAKNNIENLMALCRRCHKKYGDKKKYLFFLNSVHNNFMKVMQENDKIFPLNEDQYE